MPLSWRLLAAALLLATASALPPGMPANVTGTYGRDFDGTHQHTSVYCLRALSPSRSPPLRTPLPWTRRQADVQGRGVERSAVLRHLGLPSAARGACCHNGALTAGAVSLVLPR